MAFAPNTAKADFPRSPTPDYSAGLSIEEGLGEGFSEVKEGGAEAGAPGRGL